MRPVEYVLKLALDENTKHGLEISIIMHLPY